MCKEETMQTERQEFQYLPQEDKGTQAAATRLKEALPSSDQVRSTVETATQRVGNALPDGEAVKRTVGTAAQRVGDALPDGETVKRTASQAVSQVQEVLPDPDVIRDEFLGAAQRLQEILPDGDDLKQLIASVAKEVRDDPDIRRHVEAAAEVATQRVETTVGSGVDAASGKVREQVERAGLEDLGYVADRVGEIVKEGVNELLEETKDRALDALPEPEPYVPGSGTAQPGGGR
jgi:type I site-specific restriction endonuclease